MRIEFESEFTKEDIIEILDVYKCPHEHKNIIYHKIVIIESEELGNVYLDFKIYYFCMGCKQLYVRIETYKGEGHKNTMEELKEGQLRKLLRVSRMVFGEISD